MFTVGDTVTIKVRNALYDVRHRYANNWIGAEFTVYSGTIVSEPWFTEDEIGITSDSPGIKIRRINKSRITEVNRGEVSFSPSSSDNKVVIVKGSNGNSYTVTKRNGTVSCSCPGYSFRKTCKHIQEI